MSNFSGWISTLLWPGEATAQLLASIQTRLLALPDDTIVLPGHNDGVSPRSTIGHERRTNPFSVASPGD